MLGTHGEPKVSQMGQEETKIGDMGGPCVSQHSVDLPPRGEVTQNRDKKVPRSIPKYHGALENVTEKGPKLCHGRPMGEGAHAMPREERGRRHLG